MFWGLTKEREAFSPFCGLGALKTSGDYRAESTTGRASGTFQLLELRNSTLEKKPVVADGDRSTTDVESGMDEEGACTSSSSESSEASSSHGCSSERVNLLLNQLWHSHMDDSGPGTIQAIHHLTLLCTTPSGRRQVLYAGGHLLLLHVLKDHLPQRDIQTAAFMALMTLCVSHTARSLVASSSMGGVAVFLTGMNHHADDAFLQTTGCGILVQLCQQDGNDAGAATVKTLIVSCNGIPIVLRSMVAFLDEARLQRYACLLLDKLAQRKAYQTLLVTEGAISVLGGTMKRYQANSEVFVAAQEVYRLLVEGSEGDLYEL